MRQITENDRNSHSGEKANSLEEKQDSSVSLLSDADYEFLFNQLLEGVAHGWHDRRIVKFFERLGDRGKSEHWVAWLERLRSQIVNLPVQSKRQLGSIMIRLGELTQSASEVREIGIASNRIGRELLFDNKEDVIWEYVGPDLAVDAPAVSSETEVDFSERLAEDFAELGLDSFTEDAIGIQSSEAINQEIELATESSANDSLQESGAESSSKDLPNDSVTDFREEAQRAASRLDELEEFSTETYSQED